MPCIFPAASAGLSPRGRGNHHPVAVVDLYPGSIPAWAGEPISDNSDRHSPSVYPRVGGGTLPEGWLSLSTEGLSPRGRGNLRGVMGGGNVIGSIPAWAGEPSVDRGLPHYPGVYPRVGGGTQVRGYSLLNQGGLSPRGRGNRLRQSWSESIHRSIPAWAGEPAGPHGTNNSSRVYPRVGGGTPTIVL